MGALDAQDELDFSDTAPEHTSSFSLSYNLYWNGGQSIPKDEQELINFDDDASGVVEDPLLADPINVVLPRWNATCH